jgi:hypothetical protein
MTLVMAAAHGIPEADLQKATTSFPAKADGTEVVLTPFIKTVKPMAKRLAALLDAKAAKLAAAQAKKAEARTKKSATPSAAIG